MPQTLSTTCCIVGGGPAGMMLGYLLARRGVDVTVLEKHPDFNRDFRGDTIHPATLALLDELGLLQGFLQVPHQKIDHISAVFGGRTFPITDFTALNVPAPYIALMPQWDFLNFLAAEAKKLPTFHLLMQHNVTGLLREGGRVTGVTSQTPNGTLEVHAPLTVGCDGRHAVTRPAAHFEVVETGVPVDILWFRLSRRESDPENGLGYFNYGMACVLIDRGDYWQCGFLIKKGSFDGLKTQGVDVFRQRLGKLIPFFAENSPSRLDELVDLSQLKLLTIEINHLRQWHAQGILCIGDAAHAMSAVGGIGINVAIQDAVAAANILASSLLAATMDRPVAEFTLAAVQQHRQRAVRITQAAQARAHRILNRALSAADVPMNPPLLLRFLSSQPWFRRFMGSAVGIGWQPEHFSR